MKQILIILGLFASVSTFAQSPRIKLNQITKDTVKGSVLISSPSDSGMVYSRDFYVAYGADTVLILYGDTLAATSGIISSVLSDGVTITGDGTTGNELKVDTLLIATIKALNDSLATISASTTPDGVTITGDGSVGNPLKVDTATVISTIKGLVDTLTNRGYLTANQTITISGDVTGSGTTAITATVVDDSHDHIISNVDFLQDSLNAKANDSDLANYVTLSGTDTITGAKTFTNTFTQSGGDANFDSGTLYVDESANRVGIGTSSPSGILDVDDGVLLVDQATQTVNINATPDATFTLNVKNGTSNYASMLLYSDHPLGSSTIRAKNNDTTAYKSIDLKTDGSGLTGLVAGGTPNFTRNNTAQIIANNLDLMLVQFATGKKMGFATEGTTRMTIEADGDVVIPRVYSNTTGTAANVNVDATGLLRRFSSSIRYKTNIKAYDKGISNVMQLNPIYYKGINDGDNVYAGFIAEEIDELGLTEFVQYDSEGKADAISYSNMTALLTKAIQEQQEQIETIQTELDAKSLIIETQEQKITDLQTTIQALITRIEILENK